MRLISYLLASGLFALLAPASAEVPRKMPLEKVLNLSIFAKTKRTTEKIKPPLFPNPVDEYTLAGLSKVEGGWIVVLLHKKDRRKHIHLSPYHFTESGFRVIAVEHAGTMKARVRIATGKKHGWVKFEPAYLIPRHARARPVERPIKKMGMGAVKVPPQTQRKKK